LWSENETKRSGIMYRGNETIKIKTFFDQETYGMTPNGATYVSCKYAHEFAEEFINRPDVEALDIKYSQNCICVIYRDRKDKNEIGGQEE
jgi:hypothetical protein